MPRVTLAAFHIKITQSFEIGDRHSLLIDFEGCGFIVVVLWSIKFMALGKIEPIFALKTSVRTIDLDLRIQT